MHISLPVTAKQGLETYRGKASVLLAASPRRAEPFLRITTAPQDNERVDCFLTRLQQVAIVFATASLEEPQTDSTAPAALSSEQPPRRARAKETMATKSIVIDLEKCIDKEVRVTFQGGREVRGVLKGFDQLVNIVLDDCVEEMHDPDDPYRKTDERRRLGLVVCRGLQVSLVAPVDGMEEIANPFIQQEEEVV